MLGGVENAWMCKPGLLNSAKKTYRVSELASLKLLAQGGKSGTGLVYERWFRKMGFSPASSIKCNNLLALLGLTVSGLGISYLPRKCLGVMVEGGLLEKSKPRRHARRHLRGDVSVGRKAR